MKLNHIFNGLPREEGIKIMKESNNIADFLLKINERKGGSGYIRFYDYCSKYEIDYKEHFKYEMIKQINHKKKTEDILVENSTFLYANKLKLRLFREKILENRCVICGNNGEWNGKKLVLHLDHINGKHNDNRLENLRILCPNCHAQTETYCGKNVKTKTKPKETKHLCKTCGKNEVYQKNNNCKTCHHKNRRIIKNRPSKETILKELETSNYTQLGKKYGVSDNTIRKWLKL